MIPDNENLDYLKRLQQQDDLHIYRARIVDNCKKNDDRLQVRIMPFMAGIKEDDILPKYSPFFQGEVVRGKTEKADGKEAADYVWVVAVPDFTYGFVLGLANSFDSINTSPMARSWNYQNIKQSLQRSGAITEDFDYNNLAVDFCNSSATFLQIRSITNGNIWWFSSTGNVISLQEQKVYLSARNGNQSGATMSFIELKPNSIVIKSDLIDLRGKKIIMGKHGKNLMGTSAKSTKTYNGTDLVPIDNVFV